MTATTIHGASPAPAAAAAAVPATAARAIDPPARDLLEQRLLWSGAFLFLCGLLTGFVIPLTQNPRMALSAHLEGVMNGMFLVLVGLVWSRLALSTRARGWLCGLVLYGTWANWGATLLAAVFGTGRSTPIAGAGHAGAPWQEAIVDFGLFSLSFAMVAGLVLVLRGLRSSRGSRRGEGYAGTVL